MIDNIMSLYKAQWFDSIGRFDRDLTFAWGIDVETAFLSKLQGKGLYVDDRVEIEKIDNIAYKMG